jgi:hypothetical protein
VIPEKRRYYQRYAQPLKNCDPSLVRCPEIGIDGRCRARKIGLNQYRERHCDDKRQRCHSSRAYQ